MLTNVLKAPYNDIDTTIYDVNDTFQGISVKWETKR